MVRSNWKGSVLILLALAGWAWSQQPTFTPTSPKEDGIYLTVDEPGKSSQKCKLLFCWQENGQLYCQVQAVTNGEIMTILNPPLPPGAPQLISGPSASSGMQKNPPPQKLLTKIFHWGNSKTCPPGFPQPTKVVSTAPPPLKQPTDKGMNIHPTVPADLASGDSPYGGSKKEPVIPPIYTYNKKETNSVPVQAVGNPSKPTLPPLPPKMHEIQEPSLPVSQTVNAAGQDPLANPKTFIPEPVKKKFETFNEEPIPPIPPMFGSQGTPKNTLPVPGHPGLVSHQPDMEMSFTPPKGGIPLGAASAVAAYNGAKMPVQYIPVPLVTVPRPTSPPMPPPPSIPNAPNPVMDKNAFSPPPLPPGANQNAFMQPQLPMMAGNPGMYGHPNPMGYPMPPMMPPQHPMGQAMMPPQYSMQMNQGYPPMHQGNPANPFNAPRNYSGPMPPNPFQQQPISPVAYQQPQPSMMAFNKSHYANPAMDRQGVPVSVPDGNVNPEEAIYQMLTTLKTSLYPAQREWAALHLTKFEWRTNPHLVQGLLVAAKEDPAANVRITCIKTLVRLGVTRDVYAPTLETIKSDVDPRVREAVQEALGGISSTESSAGPILPAAHTDKK